MNLDQSIQRMRRFLRDPGGLIWSDADITAYFNEATIEISQKTQLLERIGYRRYPPVYTWAYFWDWEYEYLGGDTYQALNIDQASQMVICYPWEASYWMSSSPTADDGMRFIMPFEGCLVDNPAEPIEIPLDSAFLRMRFVSFDKWPILPITRREVMDNDRFWKTRVGSRVLNYYRPDEYGYKIVLYPRPAAVTWQDSAGTAGLDDSGGLITDELFLSDTDTGLPIEVLDLEGSLFTIYDAVPYSVENMLDEIPWPDWFVKYIEYATLERAFGADTDGYIPSLRDYWRKRKEIGVEILKKLKRMRLIDQDLRFGGPPRIPHSKGGSLPAGYPPVYR